MRYVLDVSIINGISLNVRDPELVFDRLTDLVKEGTVCFCNEVMTELKRLAEGELAYTWAKAAGAATRREKGARTTIISGLLITSAAWWMSMPSTSQQRPRCWLRLTKCMWTVRTCASSPRIQETSQLGYLSPQDVTKQEFVTLASKNSWKFLTK